MTYFWQRCAREELLSDKLKPTSVLIDTLLSNDVTVAELVCLKCYVDRFDVASSEDEDEMMNVDDQLSLSNNEGNVIYQNILNNSNILELFEKAEAHNVIGKSWSFYLHVP